jgi:hypothetical protein
MKRLVLSIDGALVLGLGLYMLLLSQTESYAAFMNPKFRLLTAVAAVGLCIVGAAFLIRPAGGTDLLRTLSFVVLSMLILHAGTGELKSASVLMLKPPEPVITVEAEMIHKGKAYLKVNPARLFFLLHTGNAPAVDQKVITRGIVRRTPELDRLGWFVLLRGNMVCCLADSVAMGVLVAADGSREFHGGEWVVAFGRMQPLADPHPLTSLGPTGEVPFSMIYDKALFTAEAVEKTQRPRFPYVFELPPSANKPARLTGGADDY